MEESFGCLFILLWLPLEIWKWMNEDSRVSTSKMDRKIGRFWNRFAMVASVLLLIILGIGAVAKWWLFDKG